MNSSNASTVTQLRDRTQDLRRLHRSVRKRQELSSPIRECGALVPFMNSDPITRPFDTHVFPLRISADNLSCSISQSRELICELEIMHKQISLVSWSDVQKITETIAQRLSQHKSDLKKVIFLISEQRFSSKQQINRHYEAIQITLQSRIIDISRNFKRILSQRALFLSTHTKLQIQPEMHSAPKADSRQYSLQEVTYQADLYPPIVDTAVDKQRKAEIKAIEETVLDLSDMLQEVSHLVIEQEHLLKQIDSNVDTSFADIESGFDALLKFSEVFHNQKKLILRLVLTFLVMLLFVYCPNLM